MESKIENEMILENNCGQIDRKIGIQPSHFRSR